MKKFLKVLGVAAAVAGLTPYKIEKNEETGEKTVRALLWKVKTTPTEDGKREVAIDVGLMLPGKDEEEDLFVSDEDVKLSDDVSVRFTDAPDPEEPAPAEAPAFSE